MRYVLNVVYLALILFASPWLVYAAIRKQKYRAGWSEKFFGRVLVRPGIRPCAWFHAVSVGEVNLLEPLLKKMAATQPHVECVISTTTKAGFELAQKKFAAYRVFYCPLDFSWAVSQALRRIRPDVLVLAELELWPNLILAASRAGVRVAVVNARLSARSFAGYRRLRWLTRRVLRVIDLVAAQTQEYADRFVKLGARPECVHVTGSVKFDGARTERNNPATLRLSQAAGFRPDDIVFLAGSTQAGEEQLALDTYRTLAADHPCLRLVLVPRHPERFDEVAQLLARSAIPYQRRSRLEIDGANPQARVLLVDTIGELGAWWGTALLAFVGGSMGSRGGQNMIEPAAYGAAVSFGPHTQNFRDVVAQLLHRQAAVVVLNGADLTAWARRCLDEPAYATTIGDRARQCVLDQRGATDRTIERLVKFGIEPQSINCPPRHAA